MKNLILSNNAFENGSKEIIDVDLSNCKNENDIFNVFKVAFRFPEWFGENWNAFDDCMQNLCFDIKDTLIVKVYGFQNIFESLKECANYILEDLILLSKGEATQDNGNKINAKIYLFDVNADCEKFILDKDISGLEFVSNDKKNICPVCGYDGLEEPAYDKNLVPSYNVCACCGVEFGVDDFYISPTSLKQFIDSNKQWFDESKKTKKWCFEKQLENLNKKEIVDLVKRLHESQLASGNELKMYKEESKHYIKKINQEFYEIKDKYLLINDTEKEYLKGYCKYILLPTIKKWIAEQKFDNLQDLIQKTIQYTKDINAKYIISAIRNEIVENLTNKEKQYFNIEKL